jgi:hypothetical protein
MDATRSMGLRLPVQGAVDRTPLYGSAGSTPGGAGVDASIDWGSLGTTLLNNLPSIIGGIASLF